MPFDDFVDLNDDLTLSDLERLDRAAAKTQKNLEKLEKKAGPILPKSRTLPSTGTGPLAGLSFGTTNKEQQRQDKKIEKRIERLTKKVEKDVVRQFGDDKKGFLSQVLGDNIGSNLLAFGKGPQNFIKNAALGLGAFAGVGFAFEIAQTVIEEIKRIDAFFKVFVDRIDERVDQLRSKQQTAEIAAGLTQVILTTESGNVEARDVYNTYNEFNSNRAKLEDDFAVRNTAGYE